MNSAVALISLFAAACGDLSPGDHDRSVQVADRERTYLVHVPTSYDGATRVPVVLAFHGGLENARSMIHFCGLNEQADQAGFIAVYPNGTGRSPRYRTWNAGDCCGRAMRENVDDVAFVRALLNDLDEAANVDPKRIYATGMSNGAMMVYRLASELSDRIAAIAPVAGPMATDTCRPGRPVSVIHFHGTADRFAPFHGGRGALDLTFRSAEYSIQAWVKANECPDEPVITKEPDGADDGTTVECHRYGPGKDGAEVSLVVVEGGGHTWPGRDPPQRRFVSFGKSSKDISANDLIWKFFQRHPMK